jgi:D-arginine dehydrogenase
MVVTDVVVIGGGIAGASLGYRLTGHRKVVMLEAEAQPGYHSTGRSAALFTATYGHAIIRTLTVAARDFLLTPPDGFSETPLMHPRHVLWIGREDQSASLERALREAKATDPDAGVCSLADALAFCPVLDPAYVAGAILEPVGYDIDVNAVHQGYLTAFRRAGGEVVTGQRVQAIQAKSGGWEVSTADETYACAVVVNAAGAWADEVATLAGVAPVGLTPKRRTAITFDPPASATVADWPCVLDVDETFYFKPDAGRILASPADETPSEPCDAWADEMDVAVCVERIQAAADLPVRRIVRSWAGLRSFVADRSPAVGFDAEVPGFFWLAGQGGYGVQTAPAAGRVAAALARGGPIPADIAHEGVTAEDLSPARFNRA